ncbi:MAG: hypothetical protein Q9216_005232 [Gyalolechia sp. 2 TL-2023]
MDPLSVTANIVTLIGATHDVVTICYNYKAAAKGAPWALSKIIDELNNLRRVLESIERLYRDDDDTDPSTLSRLQHVKQLCAKDGSITKELEGLAKQLCPPKLASVDGSRRQALMKSLQWPLKEGEAKKILRNVERLKSTLELALTADHMETQKAEFKTLRQSFRSMHDSDQYQNILKWLSAPDPSTNFNAALKRRHIGTGKWLLENHKYQDWKAARGSFLWLHGIPGCGKTVLSSTIIEDLRQGISQPDEIVIYFYFDFNDASKQHVDQMLHSLLVQLSYGRSAIPESLAHLYESHGQGSQQPLTSYLMDTLRALVKTYRRISIVLDALDECESRQEPLDFIKELVQMKSERLSLVVTGRKMKDLDDSITSAFGPENSFPIADQSVNDDIRLYVEEILQSDQRFKRWHKHPEVLDEIGYRLIDQAGGMFRWVSCQLDALSACRSLNKLRQTLDTLPTTLGGTYDRILCNIDPMFKRETLHILQWLVYSKRPLTIEEVAELVAFDIDGEQKFDAANRLADVEEVLDLCPSLILCTMPDGVNGEQSDQAVDGDSIDQDTGGMITASKRKLPIIRIAHFTVKEYLISDHIRQGPAAFFSISEDISHLRIAETCLSCLLLYEKDSFVDRETFATQFPVAEYSACYWLSHFKEARRVVNESHNKYAAKLFLNERKFNNWKALCDLHPRFQLRGQGSSLYYAVLTGSYDLVEALLRLRTNPDWGEETMPDTCCASPARDQRQNQCCHAGDYTRIGTNTHINATGEDRFDPLQTAAWFGWMDIVELLLMYGANPNVYRRGIAVGSALCYAAQYGSIDTVRLLLDNGADIHEGVLCSPLTSTNTSQLGSSSSQALTSEKHELSTQRLGSEPTRTPLVGGAEGIPLEGHFTALCEAARRGDLDMANLLLDRGAMIDFGVDSQGGTPLMIASINGNGKMVGLLLERGALIDKTDISGYTALNNACFFGHENTARLLLEKGADVSYLPFIKHWPNRYNNLATKLKEEQGIFGQGKDMRKRLIDVKIGRCESIVVDDLIFKVKSYFSPFLFRSIDISS